MPSAASLASFAGIEVRTATTADSLAIAQINVDAWTAAYPGIVSETFLAGLSVSLREQTWRERIIGDPTRPVLVAERDHEVIGYCGLATPSRDDDAPPGVAEVAAMYMAPTAWRLGAGRALMTAAIRELRKADWHAATLWVFEANTRARGFYEHCGFVADGSAQTHLDLGNGALEIRMHLTL